MKKILILFILSFLLTSCFNKTEEKIKLDKLDKSEKIEEKVHLDKEDEKIIENVLDMTNIWTEEKNDKVKTEEEVIEKMKKEDVKIEEKVNKKIKKEILKSETVKEDDKKNNDSKTADNVSSEWKKMDDEESKAATKEFNNLIEWLIMGEWNIDDIEEKVKNNK